MFGQRKPSDSIRECNDPVIVTLEDMTDVVQCQQGRLGTGIIDIEHLEHRHPDPFHAWCPLCKKEEKTLKAMNKKMRETFNPWLHRLEAGISGTSWKNRTVLETEFHDGQVFHRLRLEQFFITKGMPLVGLVQSLSKDKRQKAYGEKMPWLLIDFHKDGECPSCL